MHVTGRRECKVQQSFVSSIARSLSGINSCAWEANMGASKTPTRCSWRKLTSSNRSTSVTRKGDCCETKGVSTKDGYNYSACCRTRNPTYPIPTYPKEAVTATRCECPRDRAHGGGGFHGNEDNSKRNSIGVRWLSRENVETQTITEPELHRLGRSTNGGGDSIIPSPGMSPE